MIIHDISVDTITAEPYDGDPHTIVDNISDIKNGDNYNLSAIHMSVHSGTHIDAPKHFSQNGEAIDEMRLNTFMGKCMVISAGGILTGQDMEKILVGNYRKRILFRGGGQAFLSSSAANVIADSRVVLVGTDANSIAPFFEEEKTHKILAEKGIAVIENLDLTDIRDGEYELYAFPIRLGGLEAAPCRAILLEQERGY